MSNMHHTCIPNAYLQEPNTTHPTSRRSRPIESENADAMPMSMPTSNSPARPSSNSISTTILPKPPKPFNPQSRNLNPLQPRHALRLPPLNKIITLPYNQRPFRQRSPRILSPLPPLHATIPRLRIPSSNLLAYTRHRGVKPSLRWSRETRRTEPTFGARVRAGGEFGGFLEVL